MTRLDERMTSRRPSGEALSGKPKTITLRFPQTCCECSTPLAVGDRGRWWQLNGNVACLDQKSCKKRARKARR